MKEVQRDPVVPGERQSSLAGQARILHQLWSTGTRAGVRFDHYCVVSRSEGGGKINMDMDMAKFEQLGCRKPRVGTRVRNGHLVAVAGEWNGALAGEAGPARTRDCNKGGAQQ